MNQVVALSRYKLRNLITTSYFHHGARVLCAIILTFVPALLWQEVAVSLTLALGVVACAIAESDDGIDHKITSIPLTLLCFIIASTSVELLYDTPWLFVLGLGTSTFIFVMLGIFGQRYGQIAFGSLLVAIYTMIGHDASNTWYTQPVLLTAGALWYGLFSFVWVLFSPYRSLHEQLAQLYFSLSRYQLEKSRFFGGEVSDLLSVRQNLAVQNIAVVNALNLCKGTLNNRLNGPGKKEKLDQLLQFYLIAQQLHERVSATHYQYSQLEKAFASTELTQGFHQLLYQLSEATHQLGQAVLMKRDFSLPASTRWTIKALEDQLDYLNQKHHFDKAMFTPLSFAFKNLKGIYQLLQEASQTSQLQTRLPDETALAQEPRVSFRDRLDHHIKGRSAIFRHAIRMSLCFVTGYGVVQLLPMQQGFWILLTCLFVCQPSFSATRKRLIERITGTFVGVALGYPLLLWITDTYGQFIILALSGFLFFTYLKNNYSIAVTFITLFVIMVFKDRKSVV